MSTAAYEQILQAYLIETGMDPDQAFYESACHDVPETLDMLVMYEAVEHVIEQWDMEDEPDDCPLWYDIADGYTGLLLGDADWWFADTQSVLDICQKYGLDMGCVARDIRGRIEVNNELINAAKKHYIHPVIWKRIQTGCEH